MEATDVQFPLINKSIYYSIISYSSDSFKILLRSESHRDRCDAFTCNAEKCVCSGSWSGNT